MAETLTFEGIEPTHGEAPVSIHLDAYYHGFRVGITQRDSSMQEETYRLIKNAKQIVELLEKDGWEPHWNTRSTTNERLPEAPAKQEALPSNVFVCPTHNKQLVKRQGQYGEFWACPTKDNGEWCKYKPPKDNG